MEKTNLSKMTLQCKPGGNCWDGMQEARIIAQAVPVYSADFLFNGVPFPVKYLGNLIEYSNVDEMIGLFNKYYEAKNDEERRNVFVEKLAEAGREKDEVEETVHTK